MLCGVFAIKYIVTKGDVSIEVKIWYLLLTMMQLCGSHHFGIIV
jgi:hypothetical protein